MDEYIPVVRTKNRNKNNSIEDISSSFTDTPVACGMPQSTISTACLASHSLREREVDTNRTNRTNQNIQKDGRTIINQQDEDTIDKRTSGTNRVLIGTNRVLIDDHTPPSFSFVSAIETAFTTDQPAVYPADSPWLLYQWPHVDTPLCFSRDEQPKGRGALMLVYAPWGSVLSGGPVIVLDVRDDGLGREYLWHDPIEDRQRWHAAELCQGVKQAVPEPHDVDRFEAVLLDRWEEKAAILEYDEGYPRAEAERLAWEALGVVAPGTAEEAA